MNICSFVGTLGKDWDTQYSSAGKPRSKNSMAIRKYNGETLWINLVIFNEKRIQALTDNTGKGDKLAVSTNLDINEHEGKYYHTFIINDFTFCGSRQQTQGSQQPQQGGFKQQPQTGYQAPPRNQEQDRDLPF